MVDFRIISTPVEICFECPFCEEEVRLLWDKINVPEYWGDEWDDVECPNCGETVTLGDYEYE